MGSRIKDTNKKTSSFYKVLETNNNENDNSDNNSDNSDDDKKISLFHKALELDNQGKYHEAIKFYKQHIQNKTSTSALFNLGLIYEENLNNPQEAIKYYKLILNHKKDIDAMTRIGLLYLNEDKSENNFKEAEKHFKLAVKQRDYINLYNLSELYEIYDELEEAKKYFNLYLMSNQLNKIDEIKLFHRLYLSQI